METCSVWLGIVSALAAVASAADAAPQQGSSERLILQTLKWTKATRASVVSIEPEMVAILARHPRRDARSGLLTDVELQGEVSDETVAKDYGWRSMRVRFDISCSNSSDHVSSMVVYPDHDAAGGARPLPVPQDWIRPSAHTYAADAIDVLCRGASPAQTVVASTYERVDDGHLHAQPITATPPKGGLSPAGPVRQPVLSASTSSPTPGRARIAQLAALASLQAASEAADGLRRSHAEAMAGLQTRIEQAQVRGKTYFRLTVVGLADSTAAGAFCAAVRDFSGQCMVRITPP